MSLLFEISNSCSFFLFKVVENTGDGYNGFTGLFTAPVSIFALSILSRQKHGYAHIKLMKNRIEIGRLFGGSDAGSWSQMGDVIILTHLEKDYEVYARQVPLFTGRLHVDFSCSFSGAPI